MPKFKVKWVEEYTREGKIEAPTVEDAYNWAEEKYLNTRIFLERTGKCDINVLDTDTGVVYKRTLSNEIGEKK